jgi:microcystin-dependent protein
MTSIVGAFPTTLQNGTLEDATQVMSLLSYIQSQVNGNACPATTVSVILKGDGSGGTTAAIPGTDYQTPIPAGSIIDYGGAAAPSGWLLCDGSAVSRTTYSALFSAINTAYGVGDGATTFNVPDYRGRSSVGTGAGSGLTNRAIGSSFGEETHVLVTGELATHNHVVNIVDPGHTHTANVADPGHLHGYNSGGAVGAGFPTLGNANGGNPNTFAAVTGITVTNVANTTGITATSNNNGSGTGHNNMQPSLVATKIIKT